MLDKIYTYDKEFTEDRFKTYIDNVFIQIHLAIMTKQLYKIKHFVSKEIYEKLSSKVEILENNKQIQMYDELNVKQTTLIDAEIKDNNMYIKANITSRYMNYLLSEEGNYISGNNKSRIEKENYLTFTKKVNAKNLGENRKCPSCGASMDINNNGKCMFCGTTFDLNEKGWILVDFEVI